MKNTEKNQLNQFRVLRKRGLKKRLSAFLALLTVISMLSGQLAFIHGAETDSTYALAGEGSGEDITIHFGEDEDQHISIHVNPEPDAEAEYVTGIKEVEAGELVTIAPADGSDLPEEAEAAAEIVEGGEAIAAVEEKFPEEGSDETSEAANAQTTSESASTSSAGGANTDSSEPTGQAAIAETQYQVFDINLENVDTELYEEGFKVSVNLPEDIKGAHDFHLYHLHEGEEPEEIEISTVGSVDKKTGLEVVSGFEFVTEGFSEFVLKYTVDFHWTVDGKRYEFSIPGGGFMSFQKLMELLGVAYDTDNWNSNGEAGNTDAENEQSETVLTLDDIEVSEATREFVAGVESVVFSSPDLVDVSKVEADTTVGQIKENRGLEVQYSVNLTEEQIAGINHTVVSAGDWALISVLPFTSEESLTVTMKDGEVFTIRVTDGQLHSYVISNSGDTYEVIVTYDDTAEIPEDAELVVREIPSDSKEFSENNKVVNKELKANDESGLINPVQFDISIVSGLEEVEPKDGSTVKVEIRLAKSLFGEDNSEEESSTKKGDLTSQTVYMDSDEESGLILFNGEVIKIEKEELTECRIAHIAEDGTAEIIGEVENSSTDDKLIMRFETESFSDYLFDGNDGNKFENLPSTIYVGDEIYMWNQEDYWVTNIGPVVSETKHKTAKADYDSNYKTVTALYPGTFRICRSKDWNNGDTGYDGQYPGKYIKVLKKRTGTTPPATIDTIDNSSIGLTLNLFDYDLDNYLDDYFNGSAHYEDTCIAVFANRGINNGHALKFWGSGIGNQYGTLNEYVEHGVTRIVKDTTDTGRAGGYPVLSTNNTSLSYLFTPSNGTDKKAYTNVNGLFKKVGDYYVYDSDQNYAWYNPATNRFEVYERTYKQKLRADGGEQATSLANKNIGFFPFHKWDDQYDLYVNWDKNLNHHFGMSMSVDFNLPTDPKAVEDSNGDPIVFEFSGDDDLWVYIDGKLAMDIGGVHQPTSGTINFKTGTVTVNGAEQMNSTNFRNRFPDLYDGQEHTLQVFYIERGGCDSNCKIMFNLTQYGDIHFDKVDEDNNHEKLEGAVFGIYKDADCTIPLKEKLKNETFRSYVAESNVQGHVEFLDIPLGTYYLKELHAPEGYPLDDKVHTVQVYVDQVSARAQVKVKIDGKEVKEHGPDIVKIPNKKPSPINLGLNKVWQNTDGESITAPEDTTATFELKRIRTYETYTDRKVEGEGRNISHLVVGVLHDGKSSTFKKYDLISGTNASVSWSYNEGYQGSSACIVNGTRIDQGTVTIPIPAAGQTASIYIVDDSENGNAVRGINVSGSQFFGNSGGGVIHDFQSFSELDNTFRYSGESVIDNRVTLPINPNTWEYDFIDLSVFSKGNIQGHPKVVFNYSYYLEEVNSTCPDGTIAVYKDTNGNIISSSMTGHTSTSGTQTIINKVPTGYLRIDKKVTFNGGSPIPDGKKSDLADTYTFNVYTDESCSKPYKVIQGEAPNQQEVALALTVTIRDDGLAQSSNTVKIPVGNYWIKEQPSSHTDVAPVVNPIKVTILANQTTEKPAIANFTNNKDDIPTDLDVLKVEKGKESTHLPGAVFELRKLEDKEPVASSGILSYVTDNDNEVIVTNKTTDGNGKITFSGLTYGVYEIKEVSPPPGYISSESVCVYFRVDDGTITYIEKGSGKPSTWQTEAENDASIYFTPAAGAAKASFRIGNTPGAVLPATGGPGINLIYLLGIMFSGFAAVGLVMRKRRRA